MNPVWDPLYRGRCCSRPATPVRQALVSSTGTFWDTVVVCLMTGLVLVTSIMKNPAIDVSGITDGGDLTTLAFRQLPYIGSFILVIGIITFAYSTILGWCYYGERCVEYLFGRKAFPVYRILYILVLLAGPLISLNLVWDMADTLNALMAIPNLIAILLLSGVISKKRSITSPIWPSRTPQKSLSSASRKFLQKYGSSA